MRIGLAIDASIDLPADFLEAVDALLLPNHLHLATAADLAGLDRPTQQREVLRQLARGGEPASTSPASVDELETFLLRRAVTAYDYLFAVTVAAGRSQTLVNLQRAARRVARSSAAQRRAEGRVGPFALRAVDSQSVAAGPGVLVWEAARLIRDGTRVDRIRERLDALAPEVRTLTTTPDFAYADRQQRRRGTALAPRLVGAILKASRRVPVLAHRKGRSRLLATRGNFARAVQMVFDKATAAIGEGLRVPCVVVSHAAEPADIPQLPGFAALADAAHEHRVQLLVTHMSPATLVHAGAGTVSVGYCA